MVDPDIFADEELPESDENREHFVVDTPRKADWACRKLAELRATDAQNKALADFEAKRINLWLAGELEKTAGDQRFFEALLTHYHQSLLELNEKAKTISLPSGKLKARKKPDHLNVEAEMFIAWAWTNLPEAVRVKREPNKPAIEKAMKETGEVMPGVTMVPGETSFTVETTEQ